MNKVAVVALLATASRAQSTTTVCANYETTITITAFQTFYETCPCLSDASELIKSTYDFRTTTGVVLLPNATITPLSSSTPTSTSSIALETSLPPTNSAITSILTTVTTTSSLFVSLSTVAQTSSISITLVNSSSNSATASPISDSVSTSSIPATTSTTSISGPTVTDDAYVNTVLRHHNIHRLNHTANALVWSSSLAETARIIASSCSYGHVVDVNGGGYGQNIGAGYLPTQMGLFITEGLYNNEVNNYDYYGDEPDLSTLNAWGHFSQVVWKDSEAVGCFTQNCSSTGLQNVGPNVPPYFTVCNYSPPGNVVGDFATNVGLSIGLPTVHQNYGCLSDNNCI